MAGHGVESNRVDGNDVLQVYRHARQAVDLARAGAGPTFLEFMTYRWREHCGPQYDNDLGYRSEREFEAWRACCPIERLKEELLRRTILTDWEIEDAVKAIRGEIEAAFAYARESPYPSPEGLGDHTYA
jgi:pyruvate dehydrogenase E1 component alpha subunit